MKKTIQKALSMILAILLICMFVPFSSVSAEEAEMPIVTKKNSVRITVLEEYFGTTAKLTAEDFPEAELAGIYRISHNVKDKVDTYLLILKEEREDILEIFKNNPYVKNINEGYDETGENSLEFNLSPEQKITMKVGETKEISLLKATYFRSDFTYSTFMVKKAVAQEGAVSPYVEFNENIAKKIEYPDGRILFALEETGFLKVMEAVDKASTYEAYDRVSLDYVIYLTADPVGRWSENSDTIETTTSSQDRYIEDTILIKAVSPGNAVLEFELSPTGLTAKFEIEVVEDIKDTSSVPSEPSESSTSGSVTEPSEPAESASSASAVTEPDKKTESSSDTTHTVGASPKTSDNGIGGNIFVVLTVMIAAIFCLIASVVGINKSK